MRQKCGRKKSVLKNSLAILLAAVIFVQQMGVQASEKETGQEVEVETGSEAEQNLSTVSSGDIGTPTDESSVSSGDLLFNLSNFVPYEFHEEEYCVEISMNSGTSGSDVKAQLKYLGSERREELMIIWEADSGKFSPVSQTGAEGNTLSSQTYTIIANESSSQKISAKLYHGEHFMGIVESNEFQLRKDSVAPLIKEVYYATGSQELQELPETGHIWGSGNLTIQVKTEDIAGEGADEAVSGVATVWVEINGKRHYLTQVDDTDIWMAEIEMPKYAYCIFAPSIFAADYAGNNNYKQLPWFYIDLENPKLDLSLKNANGVVSGWYSEALHEKELQIQIDIEDKSTIEKIEISKNQDFSTILETITEVEKRELYSYQVLTKEGLIQGEQDESYYVRVFDKWGNSTTKSIQVSIDNTAPKDKVEVQFCGTADMLVCLNDTTEGAYEYTLSQKQGCIYDKNKIGLVLVMEDGDSEKAESGIGQVKFTLQKQNLLHEEEGITYEDITLNSEDFLIREDGRYEARVSLDTSDSKNYEKSFQIRNLCIADRAGNVSPGSVSGMQDQVLYYIDNSAPRVEFIYGTTESGEGRIEDSLNENERFRYFNQPYTARIMIQDANLREAEVTNALIESNKRADITRLTETADAPVSTKEQYQYTLSEDGKYRLSVKADDILHNGILENGEMITILSDNIVVDTVAPQIDISICDSAGEMISGYANQYFAQDMTIQLRIEEPYLDMETVEVSILGTDAEGKEIAIVLEPDSWIEDGSAYTNQYQLTTEGYYTVFVSCKDKAGNSSEKVTEGFYIDKTAPVVHISYDKNEPLNQFYYNTERTATVTVADYSFDAAKAQFQVKAVYGGQPVISEWTHQPDEKCDGSNHTENCTYVATVKFDKDDIYDFTFSCIDKAGLESEALAEEHFVIDQTAPVISITFDSYEASHEYFYNQVRTAYVQVEDISFDADLVKIVKSETQAVDDLPDLSDFSDGGRLHTASLCFDQDGIYQFTADATDLAGNAAEVQVCPLFIIDMTAPEVIISGVDAFSANKGIVMPKVEYRDKYLSDEECLLEISGYYHGTITGDMTKETITEGYLVSYADFPHTQDTDDLYNLNVVIKDYAGNETTETLTFSVNRFGSVYVLSDESRASLENYYLAQAPKLVITEINVDNLEKRQVTSSRDGETTTLTEGKDYMIQKQGTDVTWKSYSYIMPAENFETEGHYAITVSSTDRAKNSSDNKSKGTEIIFAVDKTAPSVVVSGIEQNGFYNTKQLTVRADMKDNMGLGYAAVYDGDRLLQEYDADALTEKFGEITFSLVEERETRDIRIIAQDLAGNVQEQLYEKVTVTTDISRIADNTTPLAASLSSDTAYQKPMKILYLVIVSVSVLFLGTCLLFWVKKRKLRQ